MEQYTNDSLKYHAKSRLNANYWKMVLLSLLSTVVASSGTQSFSGGFNLGFKDSLSQLSHHSGFHSSQELAAAIVTLSILSVIVVVIVVVSLLLKCLLFNPLEIGCDRFFVKNIDVNADLKEVCFAFDRNYKNHVKTLFLRDLYCILWSILFVIPGLIKCYQYRMVPYLLAEYPDRTSKEIFAESKRLMKGNKWRAFLLDLSFVGWNLLATITCGILSIFFVNPYQSQVNANFYVAVTLEKQPTAQADVYEESLS